MQRYNVGFDILLLQLCRYLSRASTKVVTLALLEKGLFSPYLVERYSLLLAFHNFIF